VRTDEYEDYIMGYKKGTSKKVGKIAPFILYAIMIFLIAIIKVVSL